MKISFDTSEDVQHLKELRELLTRIIEKNSSSTGLDQSYSSMGESGSVESGSPTAIIADMPLASGGMDMFSLFGDSSPSPPSTIVDSVQTQMETSSSVSNSSIIQKALEEEEKESKRYSGFKIIEY
jgi:hypothetical protein